MTKGIEQRIAVHVTPKASRTQVSGLRFDQEGNPEIQVRVSAPPEGGKANKAVCEVVAKALGIAKGKVQVVRGDTSRHKMLAIEVDDAALKAWVEGLPAI